MAGHTPTRGRFAGQRFGSYRQYRNALAHEKGYPSWYAQQRAGRQIRNRGELTRLHPEEREARRAALDALNLMRREGLSLKQAAARADTTSAAVLRHAGSALELEGGRYRSRPGDRLLRSMAVLGQHGIEHEVEVRGSRSASLVGEHWSAIHHYLLTGDASRLEALEGRSVAGIPLETDPYVIDEWERRGELEIEDIYDLTS
jgi:hypothetical protein